MKMPEIVLPRNSTAMDRANPTKPHERRHGMAVTISVIRGPNLSIMRPPMRQPRILVMLGKAAVGIEM